MASTDTSTPWGHVAPAWRSMVAVTVVVGNNLWAGGTNNADFAIPAEVSNATVSVDGVALVKDGKLVDQTTVTAR